MSTIAPSLATAIAVALPMPEGPRFTSAQCSITLDSKHAWECTVVDAEVSLQRVAGRPITVIQRFQETQ